MFEVARYVPILHARLAEHRAYRELPSGTKDLIFPVFVARPWPNANSLASLWENLITAVAGRRFGVDLDVTRKDRPSDKPAQAEFNALFEPGNAFENYYNVISDLDGAVPVLRAYENHYVDIDAQIARINMIGRGGFVRVRRQEQVGLQPLLDRLSSDETDGIAIILDAGWARDLLAAQAWALGMASAVAGADPNREIVICGSSFPADFGDVTDRHDFQIYERSLFAGVRQSLNANLFYGDWGSTREPTVDNQIRRGVARIDVPRPSIWRSFRSEKYEQDPDGGRESYQEIAARAIDDFDWGDVPSLWGSYLIECTAQGLSDSIRSQTVSASARVNIHLHIQAHFDTPELMNATDEPYQD